MPTDCTSDRHWLGTGYYDWGTTYDNGLTPQWQSMWLGAGWYTMITCLDPKNGFYRQTAELDPDYVGWQTNKITADWYFYVSAGTHPWGTYLDPLF